MLRPKQALTRPEQALMRPKDHSSLVLVVVVVEEENKTEIVDQPE